LVIDRWTFLICHLVVNALINIEKVGNSEQELMSNRAEQMKNEKCPTINDQWALPLSSLSRALFLVMIFASLSAVASARPVIVVRAETIARSDKLTLGDIAAISNADQSSAEVLKKINLGYSPEVGMVRQIFREKIAIALAAAGFLDGSVELKSQPFVTVRRESQTVDLNLVREVVENTTLAGLRARGAKAEFVKLELPAKVEVRTGAVELRASTGNVKNVFAPFSVSVEVWVDGRTARRFNVTAQIEATASVVVASIDLAERSRVRSTDYKLQTVRLDRDLNTYIFDPLQLRGATLCRALSKGQPITTDSILPDIVVKPGDVVRIIGESGRLSISLTGEARAAGHVGDRIQVKNLQSGTILQAVIVDEGIVSVRF
jgi:flagella basal body P-ring formation protein FlgA